MTTDPVRFRQVLRNYLSGALKLTPRGGTVDVRAGAEGEEAFRLEVECPGAVDLPEKAAAQLGLEWALPQRLVEAQGGLAGVRSPAGQGSVFFAVLPRRGDAARCP